MSDEITYNEKDSRYELSVDDSVVYANVRKNEGVLYIDYVFAPPELRGTGAAGRFMKGLMEIVRSENLKAVPLCGYAAGWLQRHSEYDDRKAR